MTKVIRGAGWVLAAFLPGALTLYLGFRSGGFYPGATSLAAAEMAVVVALRFAIGRRPVEGLGLPLGCALATLGGFAAWTLLSSGWSDSVARALPEYTRALLYLVVLLLFGVLPFSVRRIRWMVYGLAAAIVVICAAGLVARTLPNVILDPALVDEDRLGFPITYWNALGLLAGVGIVFCGHLACSVRDPWPARVLGAAAVPLLALTLFYTLSRGATWATVGAVVVYVLVGRPRGLLAGVIATAPTTLIVLLVANPPDALTHGSPTGPMAVAAGEHVAVVLCACMGGAALLRASFLPLDRWARDFHLPGRARGPALGGAAAVGVALVVSAGIALNVPGAVDAKYKQLTDPGDAYVGGGSSRLFNASTNGRQEHWEVALEAFRRNRLHGKGAGTYALLWSRDRSDSVHVKDAHSLYAEVLGELGLVGFVLVVATLLCIVGAFAFRARGPDRALFAALLAAGLGWAAAAGVDWDWEMPAVTLWLFAFGGAALARSPRSEPREPGIGTVLIRVVGVAVCLVVAILPARVAISEAHLDNAIDDLDDGDCGGARAEARTSLDVVEKRAAPFVVIAYCDMSEGNYQAAALAMAHAREQDPHNWEAYYGLAVARAAAGLDPRHAAKVAARLNPGDPLASEVPMRFRGTDARVWKIAGRNAALLPPARGDP